MFENNNTPDYYNDAVRDARVNSENIENQSNSKGKLLLILNLLLISSILGYFIYQNMIDEQKTAVMGVNYTVDIHEDKSTIEKIEKDKISTDLKNIINNSKEASSTYVEALDSELTGKTPKKIVDKHQNEELENSLANIDTKGFSETTNVVKIDNEAEIDTELDINALAEVVNSLVSEEPKNTSTYEEELQKVIPMK